MSSRPNDPEAPSSPPPSAADPAATTLLPSQPASPDMAATLLPSQPASADTAATMLLPSLPGYEILRELGRGGMGVVYQARQLGFNRLVAVKMILSGSYAGDDERERFRTEAEVVARLLHSNIVQVYEVGEHEGRPFFSMEFCSGGALDKKLNGTPLPPAEAVRLAAMLARAVQAAHDKGVVHRDLKPANVLLAEDGTPKIMDFGLAKKLDEKGRTATGVVMGTPSYMAPEQAGGKTRDIGPGTDVYALGAILYECLTGRAPFKGPTTLDTLAQVLSVDPTPPRQLQTKTPRDLETICLKCLAKEPARRYGSAQALAEDLERFLDGRPIQARPTGPVERLVKWTRRRPTIAALLAVSVLAVLAGLGLVGWYQVQLYQKNVALTQALADKQKENDRNEGMLVSTLKAMDEFGDVADDAVGSLPAGEQARRTILEKRLEFYAPFLRLEPDNPRLQERKARGLMEVAKIHRELGEPGKAAAEIDEAIRLYEAAGGASPTPPLRNELGRACVERGVLLSDAGRRDDAGRQYERGVGLLQGLIDEDAADPLVRRNLAEAYHDLALLRMEERRWTEALDAFGKAVDLCKGLTAEDEKDDHSRRLLAENYADRCGLYRLKGEPERGREDADAALTLYDQITPDLLAQETYQDSLAEVHYHRALLLSVAESARAFTDYEAAWTIWDRLHAPTPGVPSYRFQTAEARSLMGRLCIPAKLEEAEAYLREADGLYAGLGAGSSDGIDYQTARDGSRYHLGYALHLSGKDDEAERIFRDLTGRPSASALTIYQLGEVLRAEGEQSLLRAQVVAYLPAVGLTVLPNPLGAYQGYFGQQVSAQTELWAAVGRLDEALDRLAEAGKRGQGRLPADLLREIAQRRFAASHDLERSLAGNRDPARVGRVRDEWLRTADEKEALAEAWPSLFAPGDAATYFRQSADDACFSLLIDDQERDLSSDQKAARQQADAARAVQLLRKAVAAGYHNAKELRGSFAATMILNDADPALKGPREEFRALLSELEKKTSP